MLYEVAESRQVVGEWVVEAINYDGDGEIYVAVFSGPCAKERGRRICCMEGCIGTRTVDRFTNNLAGSVTC